MNKEELVKYLRCPMTGNDIVVENGRWICAASGSGIEYNSVDGRPVLVDFTKSVLNEEECLKSSGLSVVERATYSGISKYARSLVSGDKKTTVSNVGRFISTLVGECSRKPVVLVVGGGTIGQGLKQLYEGGSIEVIAFDIYSSQNIDFIADAGCLPVRDSSVDGVIIQAVLEHVVDPPLVVSEIHRVLRSSGLVYAETPFLQQVHEGAYDFTRYTERGHRYLFRRFEELASGASAGIGSQMLWNLDYFFRSVFRSRRIGKIMKVLFFWLVYVDEFVEERYKVDAASGVYFLGRKTEQEISLEDLIAGYRGAQ